MFILKLSLNINIIQVFTYDKLNYGLKIHARTDC